MVKGRRMPPPKNNSVLYEWSWGTFRDACTRMNARVYIIYIYMCALYEWTGSTRIARALVRAVRFVKTCACSIPPVFWGMFGPSAYIRAIFYVALRIAKAETYEVVAQITAAIVVCGATAAFMQAAITMKAPVAMSVNFSAIAYCAMNVYGIVSGMGVARGVVVHVAASGLAGYIHSKSMAKVEGVSNAVWMVDACLFVLIIIHAFAASARWLNNAVTPCDPPVVETVRSKKGIKNGSTC